MTPVKRDRRGRRLAADITPFEAEEAEALRVEAEDAGWRVSETIEQRDGWRPCAYGWQFYLHIPLARDEWVWAHVSTYFDFYFWTRPERGHGYDHAALARQARERIIAWEERSNAA